jgi:hypothetical protein
MTILPEFHDQLYAAARRQARRRLPGPGIALPRRLGTIVLIGLSTAVTIAVVVVALTAGRAGPGTAPATKPSSVATSRTELLHTLAALRTPQTAAGRRMATGLTNAPSNQRDQGYPQVDGPLVRTVSMASGGALTLVPTTFRQTKRHLHGLDTRVTFTLHGPRIEGLARLAPPPENRRGRGLPVKRGALRAHGVNVFTYVHRQNAGVVVVPDGVTTVRLSEFRVTSRVHVDPISIPAVTASVQDNIAVFDVVAPTVMTHGGPPGDGASGMYSTGAYAPYDLVRTTRSSPQTDDDPHRIQLHRSSPTLMRPTASDSRDERR